VKIVMDRDGIESKKTDFLLFFAIFFAAGRIGRDIFRLVWRAMCKHRNRRRVSTAAEPHEGVRGMPRLSLFALDERPGSCGATAISPILRVSLPTRTVARGTLIVAASLWLAVAAISSAQAEVVFGNLGPDGDQEITAPLSWTQTNTLATVATQTKALAMGFTTTSDNDIPWVLYRNLASVTLGISHTTSAAQAKSVAIHADNGGFPATSPLWVSDPVLVTGTTPQLYTFTFATTAGQVVLDRNTTYWVVPSEARPIRWFRDNDREMPTAFAGSGYASYVPATRRLNGLNTWTTNAVANYSLSIAVIPVPESSTLPLAGIGLVVGGWVARQRRKRAGFEGRSFMGSSVPEVPSAADGI
jgi:hypothetical protein